MFARGNLDNSFQVGKLSSFSIIRIYNLICQLYNNSNYMTSILTFLIDQVMQIARFIKFLNCDCLIFICFYANLERIEKIPQKIYKYPLDLKCNHCIFLCSSDALSQTNKKIKRYSNQRDKIQKKLTELSLLITIQAIPHQSCFIKIKYHEFFVKILCYQILKCLHPSINQIKLELD